MQRRRIGGSGGCCVELLGGVRPLAFGQYGEWGAGFEELVRDIAELGQEEAADRYLLASREAPVGIQWCCLRQRTTGTVLRAQAGALRGLPRLPRARSPT